MARPNPSFIPFQSLELHRRRAGEAQSQSLRVREHAQLLAGYGLRPLDAGALSRELGATGGGKDGQSQGCSPCASRPKDGSRGSESAISPRRISQRSWQNCPIRRFILLTFSRFANGHVVARLFVFIDIVGSTFIFSFCGDTSLAQRLSVRIGGAEGRQAVVKRSILHGG
jgi:hypothetical protein